MVLRSYVGAPVKRKEDPRLITGSSIYVDDITLPGMVHLAVVRSPYAHAKIVNIDTAEALTMPGVVAVVTGSDLAPMLTNKYPVEAYEGPGEPPEEYIPQAEQDDTIILLRHDEPSLYQSRERAVTQGTNELASFMTLDSSSMATTSFLSSHSGWLMSLA